MLGPAKSSSLMVNIWYKRRVKDSRDQVEKQDSGARSQNYTAEAQRTQRKNTNV
jgi:hypothetical protein